MMICLTFERKDFELFLAGQAVLQMSQISSCIRELLNVFEDPAQLIHTIAENEVLWYLWITV